MQKAPKIEFQITSTQGYLFEQECIILWMRYNGKTVNSAINMAGFQDKESIKITLNAFIDCALEQLFPVKEKKCKKHKK